MKKDDKLFRLLYTAVQAMWLTTDKIKQKSDEKYQILNITIAGQYVTNRGLRISISAV